MRHSGAPPGPKGADGIAGTGKEGQGQGFDNIGPVVPFVQIGETVGAHDPDEVCLLHGLAQGQQGFSGVMGVCLTLKVGHHKAGMLRYKFG